MTPNVRRPLAKKLWIAFLALVAILVLAEVGARIYVQRFASLDDFGRYASLRQVLEKQASLVAFTRHPYLGYYPQPGFEARGNRHNALGFRGEDFPREKPPGEFRIVCIGGSTTYDSGVKDPRDSYPALLQDELRRRGHADVRVINAGCNGWCTHESLINLQQRVLELSPDLLIVLHSANDLHARLVWPPERYQGDNSGFRVATSGISMPGVHEYSALWRILAVKNGWMEPHSVIERTLSKQPPWSYASAFRTQVANGSYPTGIFRTTPAESMLATNAPIYYRRNLTEIVRTARQRGIGCVLASFVYNPHGPRTLSGTPEYARGYAEHEEVQRAIAEAEGVGFFDLRAAFPAEERYFTDDMHLNAEGNRIKADLFADFLEAEDLLPR